MPGSVSRAPFSGTLSVDTCGTHDRPGVDLGMDTILSLHTTCNDTFNQCNDDGGNCAVDTGNLRDSFVTTSVVAGETILIRVTHFEDNFGDGSFLLRVSLASSCPGDISNDGQVDVSDLVLLLARWDMTGPGVTDLDGDLVVGVGDLLLLLSYWGDACD